MASREGTTQGMPTKTKDLFRQKTHDFSLVQGGRIFQFSRGMQPGAGGLEHLRWWVITLTLIAWLPLLFLSGLGSPAGSLGQYSFLRDVEMQFRFIIALPALIFAEWIAYTRIRPVVRRFVERGIVVPEDLPRFDNAIESTIRLRDSVFLEAALVICVYTLGLWLWNSRVGVESPTWYAKPGGRWHLTPAGIWYVFVSIPIVQFLLLRWYARLFIWYHFLWRVSKLKLHLVPTHPDLCAGLAFVGKSAWAFGPILFAQGAMLAGIVASRVLYRGESLMSFKVQMAGFVVFFVVAILGPLLMFTPQMARAKRKGLADYGQLAQGYVDRFEQKWILRDPALEDELLGAADIQSLADLNNSYGIVRDMRTVPFRLEDITRLAAWTAAPLVPLLLTIFSLEELVTQLVKVVF